LFPLPLEIKRKGMTSKKTTLVYWVFGGML
jgi:hypothetical protein